MGAFSPPKIFSCPFPPPKKCNTFWQFQHKNVFFFFFFFLVLCAYFCPPPIFSSPPFWCWCCHCITGIPIQISNGVAHSHREMFTHFNPEIKDKTYAHILHIFFLCVTHPRNSMRFFEILASHMDWTITNMQEYSWPRFMVHDHMVWTINNMQEYSKSNLLQEHYLNAHCSRSIFATCWAWTISEGQNLKKKKTNKQTKHTMQGCSTSMLISTEIKITWRHLTKHYY